MPKDNCTCR